MEINPNPDILNLWRVDVDESKLSPNSTEDDIKNLGDGYKPKEEETSTSLLSSQLPLSSDISRKKRKLLELSEPLLNNIWNGTTWCIGHLKTTRVFRVMEQLEEEGYLCLFFSSNRSQVPGLHIASVAYISFFSETVYLLRRLKQITKYYSGEHSAIISSGLLPSISKIILSLEYVNEERIIINQEAIKDIYMLTNGHAGLVINCGKAIDEKLKKGLDEIDISIKRFLSSVQINDSEEKKEADFLTAEEVLTVVDKDDNIYRMSSAFMDELIR
ncbi:hypothetical protein RhiirA4_486376 [Rhizophagus irregularis]|uniref:Uncharacterized protein n=1 Tax=Rhizophagus irregularis TaxID=588596 RepID=A0A2I1HNQ7_9GLOM|nr:hypothetical protein RhiirA4_484285 [Rhizophagus irregularis]PKY61426.1 hypothetical protein RhiirA4_486376 [Rhizophagus irregularis]